MKTVTLPFKEHEELLEKYRLWKELSADTSKVVLYHIGFDYNDFHKINIVSKEDSLKEIMNFVNKNEEAYIEKDKRLKQISEKYEKCLSNENRLMTELLSIKSKWYYKLFK